MPQPVFGKGVSTRRSACGTTFTLKFSPSFRASAAVPSGLTVIAVRPRAQPIGNVESLGTGCLRKLANDMLRQHGWLQQVSIRAWCWIDACGLDESARERVSSCVTDVQLASSVELPEALLRSDESSRSLVFRLLERELAAGCCDHYAELVDGLTRFGARQITLSRRA